MSKALVCDSLVSIRSIFAVATLLLLFISGSRAQTTSVTDGSTPLALTPGAPAGSYPLSGFENVNLYNGNLNFALPIIKAGGRGEAQFAMLLTIEQHWKVSSPKPLPNCELTDTCDRRFPSPSLWGIMNPDYGPGVLQGRKPGVQCGDLSLTRLTFTVPGGTEFELRDQLNNGRPLPFQCNPAQGASRGTVFVTADGSAATFVSDTPIFDNAGLTPTVVLPSGYLMLRNGTRSRIDEGKVTWIRDRNGNKLTFTYSGPKVTSITDSLNRQINIAYAVADVAPYGTCDQITFKGFGGAPRTIRVSKTPLASALRTTQAGDLMTPQTFQQLFPELPGSNPSIQFNPTVVSSLWLPDGLHRYRFYYNVYGELARVEVPTGATSEYDFANETNPNDGIIRRVTERRVYANGVNLESKTTYGPSGAVVVDTRDANGTLLALSVHYFHGIPFESLSQFPTQYSKWKNGLEYRTDFFASDGTTLLKVVENTWQQREPVSWWTGNPDSAPPNDPRISETVTRLSDTNQVSKQTFGYDKYNNQTDVYEYEFGSGAAGALVRRSHIDYLTSSYDTLNPNSSNPDLTLTRHIRSLPAQASVFDAGGVERARATIEYDNYTLDGAECEHSFHCPLVLRSDISGLDSLFSAGYTMRGNPTAATSYLLSNGLVTGSVSSYTQYDVAGNVVRVLDPRSTLSNNIATTIDYDDKFGTPNNEARSNTTPSELTGFISYAFPTKVTNALGHTSYSQFDYYLGKPVNGEDANGVIASGTFDDMLDRPTQIRRGIDSSAENQTTFAYDDAGRSITTSSDRDAADDKLLVGKVFYDKMGRTIETQQYESSVNFIAIKTQYDALGRPFKTSNPFRPWQSESPVWTTQAFDSLGRVISVATPDNAVVSTSYSGNSVTATDQAGKRRKSVTDALGRLRAVYEDPDSLNYLTSYDYNVLDDLTIVSQGSQTRTFAYDSLKRLTTATNPENGTISYQYDNNSNLLVKTDARNVSTHLSYDALNRLTRHWYNGSNSTSATTHNSPVLPTNVGTSAEATFYYDSQSMPSGAPSFSRGPSIGRPVATTYGTGSSAGDYFGYDALGRSVLKIQQIGSVNYQMTASYNLAAATTSAVYPSGHVVNYSYDAAGRTATVAGNLGDGTSRNYASSFVYNPRNQITQELFGTDAQLYHKLQYNIRGQLWDVRVSTGSDVNGSWNRGCLQFFYDGTYGFGTSGPDNNGNLRKSKNYVPLDDQSTTWAIHDQTYNYDPLNRLTSVAEEFVSSTQPVAQQSQQSYSYDRWGNRNINAAQTWGTGINNKQFTVDAANNRLGVPSGQTGTMSYDTAGNLTTDTYTGAGAREYDAENKMTRAWGGNNQWQEYTYNADGQRTRRKVDGQETWQIYGMDGELLAEYAANGSTTAPQKEYGYRNGQLLITAEAASLVNTNFALASNGGTASASSTYVNPPYTYPVTSTTNGDRKGVGSGYGGNWAGSSTSFPQWVQVDFNGSKTITEIDVFSLQDNYSNPIEPTESTTFSTYGLTGFDVQYWNGSGWATVPGGSVTGNNKVWKKITFTPLTTSKIRVLTNASSDGFSRVVEVEAWGQAPATVGSNVALASNGGTASASSTYVNPPYTYPVGSTINGDRKGVGSGYGGNWAGSSTSFPQWVQVDFSGSKTITEIDVFSLQDDYSNPIEPTESTTFSTYGLTGFDVQYWNGSAWATVPGGSVSGNNKVWKKITFAPLTTTKIRVLINASSDGFSRVVEVEAWTAPSGGNINWLVSDHLGTPRIIVDKTGERANVKRHDYLPFGEELFAGTGGRSTSLGYTGSDGVRQQFTEKERDVETGLDYFLARYYSSTQGRFTSPDEFTGGPDELYYFVDDAADNPTFYADLRKPQSLNKYQHAYNNPLRYIDPDGHDPEEPEPPQDPRPVVPLPPIPGAPPLVVPGPTTSTPKGPTDAEIIEGGKAVLDTVADYTGITWIADKIRPFCPFCPKPAPAPTQPTTAAQPSPTTGTPPQTIAQPQAPPPPSQASHRSNRRPSNKPKHQRGTRRKQADKGGEKADPRRERMPWHRKRPDKWKGPWPPKPKPPKNTGE